MTYAVLKQWRQDIEPGQIVAAGDFGLSDIDIEFLFAAGFIKNASGEQQQPAKLKNSKRKD